MFCKKLCCDITIRLITINFQSCITYSVTPCINITLLHTSNCEFNPRSPSLVVVAPKIIVYYYYYYYYKKQALPVSYNHDTKASFAVT
jgi:hypothetical protein